MKRVLSIVLIFVLAVSMVPSSLITVHALDSRVENAIQWAINIANDDSHGYSQTNRNGPDYDCSSFVSTAFKNAGFGVSGSLNTGNMLNAFTSAGFTKYNKGAVSLQRGDILLRPKTSSRYGHTELYIGNNQCVAAHDNYDDKTGDGNGKEINVRSKNYCTFCKNSDYTYILRYEGSSSYDNYTYSFSFNANGGTLGSSGAFSVSYGDQFEILNTTCTRSGYTWAGWNVKRNNDNKWYVSGQGWCTESQISSNGYTKKTYSNYETATLNDSWTSGISGDCSYTFYAKWIQSRQTQIRIFMSPYGSGYDHVTALNNATRSGFAQEYIYAWYILYDANTGELLNTYSNDNYSVELAIYDPNGSLVFNENYTGSNDANWIGISPQMSGTYTATAKLTGDLTASVTTTYEVSYDAELLSSPESVSLNLNGTNSATIAVTPSGAYPGNKNATVYYNGNYVSVSSRWSNGQILITVGGLKVADTSIRVDLYENYTGNKNVVAQVTIPVKVTGNCVVTFNANGGSVSQSSKTVTYGSTYGTLPSPTRTGHTFLGWYTSSSGGSRVTSETTVTTASNHTLYAQWTPYAYTITYNANGGSGAPSSQTKYHGTNLTLSSTVPTRSGYKFLGWSTSSTATSATYQPGSTFSANAATTLYAVWQTNSSITYNANGGSGAPSAQTGSTDYTISSTVPTRFGYTFLGWSTSSTATTSTYEAGDTLAISGNVILYAVWKSATTLSMSTTYSAGINFANQEVYYTFTPASSGTYTFESTGSVDSKIYLYNSSGTELGNDDDSSDEGTNFKLTMNLTGGTKYFIKVRAYSTNTGTISFRATGKYTVTYDANGGTGAPSSQTKYYGINIVISSTIPTKNGYTFLGWATSSTATSATYQPGSSLSVNANTTLYAVWRPNPTILNANSTNNAVVSSAGEIKYYTFTPETTGLYVIYSTSTSDTEVYLYNANGTELTHDDDSGDNTNFRLEYNLTAGTQYTFGIMYYNTSLTGTIPFTFRRVYMLTYDANGGTGAPSPQKKEHGAGIFISSTEPTKSGYTFLGWSTSSSATSATYQPGSGFSNNSDTTLYAVWKINHPTLSINSTNSATISNSGEMKYFVYTPDTTGTYVIYSTGSVDSKVYLYDANGTQLSHNDDGGENRNFRLEYNLTAGTQYTFGVCCYSSLTGTIPFTFGRVYTVSYNANGGTGEPSSQKKDYGKSLTLSSTEPSRSGYTFLGWATSSTATTAAYHPGENFAGNMDTILYAVWSAISIPKCVLAAHTGGLSARIQVGFRITNSSNIAGYYWGTSSIYNENSFTESSSPDVDLYINSKGTYYFTAIDINGNISNTIPITIYEIIYYKYRDNSGFVYRILSGSNYELSIPEKEGYTFLGWSTSRNSTSATYEPGTRFVADKDATYYSVWEANTYRVTYNANGGINTPTEQTKTYDSTLALSSTVPTRSGYKFLGWSTSSTATSAMYQPGDDFTTNADTTLYAVWEELVLSSISVYSNPNKLGYYLGDSFDSTGLKIKLTYSDGSTEIITSGFTVSGFNSTSSGTKTVTVSYGGKTTTFTASVVTPYVSLSSTALSMNVGDIMKVTVSTVPFAQLVTWTSSNTSVATVANGVITANAEGTAIITAEFIYNGITYSETCDVTVSKPVHTHIASDWITDQNATCTTDGRKHKECTTCGETIETVTISATGHTSSDWIIDKNASCTASGSKHKECTTCGEILVTTVIVSTGHISSDWIVDRNATCTVSGSKHKECTTCGGILETTVIASTGHSSSDWIVDRNATCTASGAKHKVCTVCGITTEISTIPATGHIYVWKNDYENLKKIGTCSVCGDVSIDAIPIVNVFTFVPNSDGSGYTLTDCISEYSGKVTVPKEYNGLPVTAIGTDAFRDCTGITSVVIPDTVTSIGGSAFRGCTNLTEIVLSDNITSIPGAMCYGCTKLETVVIPEGIVNIGGYAFSSCTKLKTVVIPDSSTNIGGNVFANCKSLIINCNEGSTAKAYADANGISYIFNNVNTKMDLVTGIIHTDILGGDLSSIMSGSDTLTYSINTSCAGTGAVVNVMKNGMLHSQYTLVINGDTNGDSVCDVLDCFEVERAANGNGDLIGVYVMAADSNADDVIDITDYQAIVNRVMES